MGTLCRLARAFRLSSIVRFAKRESVGSIRSAPRVFSDGLRRRGSSRFSGCPLARRPIPWRPFVAPLRGTIPRPRENLGEPDRSIGVVSFAGLDRRRDHGRPLPPVSEPAIVQLPRPMTMPRTARSAAALERQRRPSSRNRAKAAQRFKLYKSVHTTIKQVISKCRAVRKIAGQR
jgi:hypothetical protein